MEQAKRTRGAKEAGRAPVERKRAPKVREIGEMGEKRAPEMRGKRGAGMRGKRRAGMRGKREAAAI